MRKKDTLILLLVVVVLIGLSTIYAADETEQSNKTVLSFKLDHYTTVSDMVNQVKINPLYKNYNHDTLNWLEEFDSSYIVFETDEYYMVMNSTDADKMPENVAARVPVSGNITCNVLQNKSLGNGLNNVLYVENVEVTSNI